MLKSHSDSNSVREDGRKKERDILNDISVALGKPEAISEEKGPRRALTAYNIFFQAERQRLLDSQEGGDKKKLGFAGLARHIAAKWKKLDHIERIPYDAIAAQDKKRYREEKKEWKKAQKLRAASPQNEPPSLPALPASAAGVETFLSPSVKSVVAKPDCSQTLVTPHASAEQDSSLASMIGFGQLPTIEDIGMGFFQTEVSNQSWAGLHMEALGFVLDNEEPLSPLPCVAQGISPAEAATAAAAVGSMQASPAAVAATMDCCGLDDLITPVDDLMPNELCSFIDHRSQPEPHTMHQLSDTLGEECVQYVIDCFQNSRATTG